MILARTPGNTRLTISAEHIYEYDAEGNLAKKTLPNGRAWRYEWDAAGMLARVVRPDGEDVTFGYDALGRRVWKKHQGKTTKWVWDGDVPVHEWVELSPGEAGAALRPAPEKVAEADEVGIRQRAISLATRTAQGPPPLESGTAASPITWVFEPESFAPAAKLVGQKRYAIIADYLGTPTAMLDGNGQTVWTADIGVYGELRNVTGNRQACPFRWPGQYEDEETGLYYNRFRYYDAEAGEYVSQDPIGLDGGDAFYGYVHDPLAWLDPVGLSKRCGPRRTKHVQNRHVDRAKYPEKSKYRRPNQIDKLNSRTMSAPDLVVPQRNGRVRYEKRFGRELGTRGETINVVVVDAVKNKIVTSFPMLNE